MSRKSAREIAVQIIYEYDYRYNTASEILEYRLGPEFLQTLNEDLSIYKDIDDKQTEYIKTVVCGIVVKSEELDEAIKKYAIGWNLGRISRIARAILRVAVFEIKYLDEVPASVAINEAVELTKSYDTQETAAFVNGILGSVAREGTQA